jgi:hypothetical protein
VIERIEYIVNTSRNRTPRRGLMKKSIKIIFFSVMSLMAGCGGGGGGDSGLFPLWVETDVVATDIDGDGLADVATLAQLSTSMSQREGRLVVYRQSSPGVFAPSDTYVVGTYPWKLAVGDIDGDGQPDLVVTDPDGHAVWLLLQDPDYKGKFLAPQLIASGTNIYEAAIGDLNSDGAPDIAIADRLTGSDQMMLLYQNPVQRGAFLPAVIFMLPGTPSNVTAGDLNSDGRDDLFTWVYLTSSGDTPNGELAISLQQSNRTLGPATPLAPQTGLNVGLLAIADYNGDGRNDLFAFFTPYSSDYNAKIAVLMQGSQPGIFSAPVDTSLAGIEGIDDATFADLNGDGRPDAAVVGFFPVGSPSTVESRLNLFTQLGDGSFALKAVYDLPIAASRVAAGDIDGDGLNDLVVLGGNNQCLILIQSNSVPGTFKAPYQL